MDFDTTIKRCTRFLNKNGWTFDKDSWFFIKDELISVDLQHDSIILLDDTGDFLHLHKDYYSLVGAMIEFR